MNRLILLFSVSLSLSFLVPTAIYPIFIKEYNLYLHPENGCKTVYSLKANDSVTLKINLLSCKGAMNVEVFLKGSLVEKGKYVNSLDLLKTYSNRVGFNRKENKQITEIVISEYYQPLRDSLWTFYKNDSITIINYKKGVQQ
jgi:hypothetical protein